MAELVENAGKSCVIQERERERERRTDGDKGVKARAKGAKGRQSIGRATMLVAIVRRINNAGGTRFCALYCRRAALRTG